jgi:hypothetical protein
VSPLRRVSEDGSFIAGWSREEVLSPPSHRFIAVRISDR